MATAAAGAMRQQPMAAAAGVMRQPAMNHVAPAVGFESASLYVGDLEASVDEKKLFDVFSEVAPVVSVRVCRDQAAARSLGYGYVNFNTPRDAALVMEILNFKPVNGRPMRIMYCQRDPSLRKSGYANVFIKNLDSSIDNKALFDTFATFGTILSCKVAVNTTTGHSKGYGFVQFDREDAAQTAIKSLNGMIMNGKQVYVALFVRRQERFRGEESPQFTNVYVKNLSESVSDEDLKGIFGSCGDITSCVVMKDASGKSKCFGFVNFLNPENAAAAVEKLNGSTHGDKVWYVGRAQKKEEREAELKAKFEQERISRYEKLQGANLYMKNLDDSINDEKLKAMFSEFGTITSCKIMLDTKGASKGSGFVCFSTPEEATRALIEMNGKMVGKKPLYVAVAQRKEERKARLQAHFAQLRAQAGVSQGFQPRMAPQPLFFGQGNPALIPPQHTGYGFHQQLLPGIRPPVAPNYMMPFHPRQVPHGQQRFARGEYPQKFHPRPQMVNYTNQGFRSTQVPASTRDIPVSPSLSSGLMAALHSASLDQQRTILGEHLYPLVEKIDNENAGKVTGMLLEMDQPEVLHLIESPDALKKKVAEAVDVLRQAIMRSSAEETAINNVQLSSVPQTN